jgi:hypothetical protein
LLLLLLLLALQLAGGIDIGVLQAETGMPKKQQPGSKGRGSLLLGSLASGGAPAGGRLLREGLAPPVTALPFDKGELKRIAHQLRLRPPRGPPAPAARGAVPRPLSHLLPPPLLCFLGSVCMLVGRERVGDTESVSRVRNPGPCDAGSNRVVGEGNLESRPPAFSSIMSCNCTDVLSIDGSEVPPCFTLPGLTPPQLANPSTICPDAVTDPLQQHTIEYLPPPHVDGSRRTRRCALG